MVGKCIAISTNLTHIYSFGFVYIIVLPVTLENFTGSLQGSNALLEWKFAQGSDMAITQLQHSTDGSHFSKQADKKAEPNTNTYN